MPKSHLAGSLALAGLLALSPAPSTAQQGIGTLIAQKPSLGHADGPGLGAGHAAPAWRNKSWLNTEKPLTLESLRGRVVLLNFWTFTCWNCTGALPSLVDFDRRYRDLGLTIVGIHSPEFPPYGGEHDRANVAKALKQYSIEYPVAQDNDHATWDLYGIQYWPSYTLIDRRGNIRYEGYGEFHLNDGQYSEWSARIEKLLKEN